MKNLLFITIEDLNDWVEPLNGHPNAFTPNMTRLAQRGQVFLNAYAPAPACSPSRTAALFSRFPWETGVYSNREHWQDFFEVGSRSSLIGRLRDSGMRTLGCGKVFHSAYRKNEEAVLQDDGDWDAFFLAPKVDYPLISKSALAGDISSTHDFGIDGTGQPSYDDLNTDWIVEQIKPDMRNTVWALGIYRPHLPFIVPQQYFDKIPQNVALPPGLGTNRFDPENQNVVKQLPRPARKLVEKQSDLGKVLDRNGEYFDFLRAYLASIAYADAKLGQVLDHLDNCGLADDTLIVLWSDHGWQLGEKLAFRKFTLWERALRVPLMFAGPGLTPRKITDPVSLVDLAPTLLGLLGLEDNDAFSGQDLSPLMLRGEAPPRNYAPSAWGTGFMRDKAKLAFSVRSDRYRLTKYWNGSFELYDHVSDPYEHENLLFEEKDVARKLASLKLESLLADLQEIEDKSVGQLIGEDKIRNLANQA